MILPLFAFPVYITKIDEKLFNKKKIIKDIEYNYKKNKNRNFWDNKKTTSSNLHHSFDDTKNKEFIDINYTELLPIYTNKINEYLQNFKFKKNIQFKFKIVNYTCMTDSQFMRSHHHNDSDFSAVHYLKFNKKTHLPTTFENTNPYKDYIGYLRPNLKKCLNENDISNSWAFNDWCFDIEENDICFSPSYLYHSVPIQPLTNDTRICVVLNIEIE